MMTREEIPEFISALMRCGCTVVSLGESAYVIDDAPIFKADAEQVVTLKSLIRRYGSRDHLKADIIQYLRNSGNCVDVEREAA